MNFRETLPSDPVASGLLKDYFEHRATGFRGVQGYQTVFPNDDQFTRPLGVFLVVEVDGTATGCGGVRVIESRNEHEQWCEIKHLWVEPSGRGTGLGRKLLSTLEACALELGGTHAVLDTNASLEAAGGLYLSAGYLEIEPYNNNPNATTWYGKTLSR